MTEPSKPSKWAMELALPLEQHYKPSVVSVGPAHPIARALDAAHAEGEAKGRREALEEAARLIENSPREFNSLDMADHIRVLNKEPMTNPTGGRVAHPTKPLFKDWDTAS